MFSSKPLSSTCKPAVACTIPSAPYHEPSGFKVLQQQLLMHTQKTKHNPHVSSNQRGYVLRRVNLSIHVTGVY